MGDGPGGQHGMGSGGREGGHGPMQAAPPAASLTIANGVAYVIRGGKLTAYEAKGLEQLGEVIFWEPPTRPEGMDRPGRGEGPGPQARDGRGHQGAGPGGMRMPPPATIAVTDGAVYVLCGDKLMAFEAKTLKVLGEAAQERAEAPEGE